MAYIGYFDEILLTAQPQVDAVVTASKSLMASDQFKKILEIVLAFGNYMNSAKRGAAYGFKLESFERLLDTRASEDRKVTLLHYIAQVVTDQYPQCEAFYNTIEKLEEASNVSLVTLQTDVQGQCAAVFAFAAGCQWHLRNLLVLWVGGCVRACVRAY